MKKIILEYRSSDGDIGAYNNKDMSEKEIEKLIWLLNEWGYSQLSALPKDSAIKEFAIRVEENGN